MPNPRSEGPECNTQHAAVPCESLMCKEYFEYALSTDGFATVFEVKPTLLQPDSS
jgi:hypothetical protein